MSPTAPPPDRHDHRAYTQVSSNLTLFYRLFVPIFFVVFVGALVVFLWAHPQAYYGNVRGLHLRVGATAFFATVLALIAVTVWRLRRVEMNGEWVYVTDYFRQARYPWSNVRALRERSLGPLRLVTVELHAPGSFGRAVSFVASRSRWRLFQGDHPERVFAPTTP